jgi:hypothetical protein
MTFGCPRGDGSSFHLSEKTPNKLANHLRAWHPGSPHNLADFVFPTLKEKGENPAFLNRAATATPSECECRTLIMLQRFVPLCKAPFLSAGLNQCQLSF